ncbi:MAG: hypothetical protein IJ617_05340, partial [Oscillospiraceae bacterium]|nr:hypothetical protein [Oscillospiraceae bacterium]
MKSPAFAAVLLLAVLLPLGLAAAGGGENGAVSVALWAGDELSREIAGGLAAEGGALRCTFCADPEAARALVASGQADAAWIFAPDTAGALARHAAGRGAAAVTVVEREDNVFLMLAREKLYAALYPALSREAYLRFLADAAGEGF